MSLPPKSLLTAECVQPTQAHLALMHHHYENDLALELSAVKIARKTTTPGQTQSGVHGATGIAEPRKATRNLQV